MCQPPPAFLCHNYHMISPFIRMYVCMFVYVYIKSKSTPLFLLRFLERSPTIVSSPIPSYPNHFRREGKILGVQFDQHSRKGKIDPLPCGNCSLKRFHNFSVLVESWTDCGGSLSFSTGHISRQNFIPLDLL